MAMLTVSVHGTRTSEPAWGALYAPPEDAYGAEGQQLGAGAAQALASWAGPSEYLASLANGRARAEPRWVIPAAVSFALAAVSFALAGWLFRVDDFCYPASLLCALASYALFARWLSKHRPRTGFLGFAERIRSCLAYEGDPRASK